MGGEGTPLSDNGDSSDRGRGDLMLALEQWTAAIIATIGAAIGISGIVRLRPR